VYKHALRTFDESQLETVLAARALAATRAEVARLRDANTPVSMVVDHSYDIVISMGEAKVTDHYVNHAVLLDPETGEPREPDPKERLTYTFTMEEVSGTWRVTVIE
jgi:hypothetical protein